MPSGDLFSTKTNLSATKLASEMCGSIAMVIIRKNSSSGAKPQTLLAVFTGIFCQFLRNLIAQSLGQADSGYLPTPL
jgi:hypothetical protein